MSDSQRFTRSEDDEDLQRLLQEAGPRPEVPAEDLDTVRDTARQAWRQMVAEQGGRAMSGRSARVAPRRALAASLVLAVAAAWWWAAGARTVATLELARGEVTWDGESGTLSPGSELAAGSEIGTPPNPSSAVALRLAAGQSLRLDAATRIRLVSADSVELLAGAVYLDSDRAPPGTGFAVITPYGTVRDVGTQFEVRLGDESAALRVRVREGEVALTREDASHAAATGEQLLVAADGAIEVRPLSVDDQDWRWMAAAAPWPEIEGMRLDVFLAWVSRETGWRVDFADVGLEREASATVLHGSVAGLTPVEALGVVVSGSGLEYRLAGDRVVLSAETR